MATYKSEEELSTTEVLKAYLKDQMNLLKINAVEQGTSVAGMLVLGIILYSFFLVFLIALGAAIVLLLGDPDVYFVDGVGYAAAFYLVVGILLFALRKQILFNPIANTIIKGAFNNE